MDVSEVTGRRNEGLLATVASCLLMKKKEGWKEGGSRGWDSRKGGGSRSLAILSRFPQRVAADEARIPPMRCASCSFDPAARRRAKPHWQRCQGAGDDSSEA